MDISENQIIIPRTARYFVAGQADKHTQEIWFAIHGYGQSASHFLGKFVDFQAQNKLWIAPEGLSRFYWKGFSGYVGASWMTKEMRESEIHEYTEYLNQVFEQVTQNIPPDAVVNIVAFSQGCTTACRWLSKASFVPKKMILCSGNFPHDWDFDAMRTKLQNTEIEVVFGKEDELIKESQFQEHIAFVNERGFYPKVHLFQGKHELHLKTLTEIMR